MPRERSVRERRGSNRPGGALANRPGGRADELAILRERARIAQAAARLIVEHGISDWSLAKRKAVRQLMLGDDIALPSNEDITRALTEHHALFGGAAHAESLRRQRRDALAWMVRLAAWEPLLTGGVAAGWATEHSDVRIELIADDPKAVEIALANAGVAYSASPPGEETERSPALTHLRIATPRATIRLSILSPQQRRNRPRRDDEPRLAAAQVSALLAASA